MVVLFITWCIYFFLHSYLASTTVKARLERFWGLSPMSYRRAYNVFNSIALLLLLLFLYLAPNQAIYKSSPLLRGAGYFLALAGFAMMLLSASNYNLPVFLGLRKETRMEFQTKGLNKFMRHPLYTATIVFILGFCMVYPYFKNWFFLLLTCIYILIGIYYEEKKLVVLFGEEYKEYQKKVSKLIPGVI